MPHRANSSLVAREGDVNPDLLSQVEDIRRSVRQQGFAAFRGDALGGFSALSAHIFDHEGDLVRPENLGSE